jgi:hypothetical protein
MSGLRALLGARSGAVERWRQRRLEIEASLKALGERGSVLEQSLDVEKHRRGDDIAVADARIDDHVSRLEILTDQRRQVGHRKCELRNLSCSPRRRFRSWLLATFSDGLPLSEIDSELEVVAAKIETLIHQIEEVSGGLTLARAAREKLGAPLDSLEFAMNYLQQRAIELRAQHDGLAGLRDSAIRDSLLRVRPDVLQIRLRALPEDKAQEIAKLVFRLKAATYQLSQLQALPHGRPSVPETTHTLSSAVTHGMSAESHDGRGRLALIGEGTKHVQKTRSIAGSDGKGGRSETYWRRERVKLSGEVDLKFKIETHRWRNSALQAAVQLRASQCFEAGVGRVHQRLAESTVPELATETENLTREIISRLNAIDGDE